MEICIDIPHAFGQRSSDVQNAYALRALLDCMVDLNDAFLKLTPNVPRLYDSGVVYGRTKVWDTLPALYRRKYGDCKSLASALIAEYRRQGIEAVPVFRWYRNKKGGNDFHILVMVPGKNGYDRKLFEDPSAKLGMGRDEVRKFYGPIG